MDQELWHILWDNDVKRTQRARGQGSRRMFLHIWKRFTIQPGNMELWKTYDSGLRGRLPLFIEGFLSGRQFQVRVSAYYSQLFDQEMGVTLFGLKINSIVKAVSPGVECLLYVDDFLICYRSKCINIIERHIQRCLNKHSVWADTNAVKFSPSKTVCMHFCRLCKLHLDPLPWMVLSYLSLKKPNFLDSFLIASSLSSRI